MRNIKLAIPFILVLALSLLTPGVTALAGKSKVDKPKISPTPQEMEMTGKGFPLGPIVGLVVSEDIEASIIEEAKDILKEKGVKRVKIFKPGDHIKSPVTLQLGTNNHLEDQLKAHNVKAVDDSEGYTIVTSKNKGKRSILLAGKNQDGIFYGIQTLRQLLPDNKKGSNWIPEVKIKDYPQFPVRGTIEGFYGPPWTHEDRLSQLDFYGQNKMNTYVYAPKDDPYHREQWREPYPEDKLQELSALVKRANQNYVDFVFTISPGEDICYSDEGELDSLISKAQEMYDLGVRDFGILFDDINPELTCELDRVKFSDSKNPAAAAQAYLLKQFQTEFVEKNKDVGRLQTVPTQYSGLGESDYKEVFAEEVPEDVLVYWTGTEVVSKSITNEQTQEAYELFQHDLLIWDNYPVNDFDRSKLFLAPLENRGDDLHENGAAGLTANPMNEAEASKLPLYTVADYTWNQDSYDPELSWKRSLQDFGGDQAEALTTFAKAAGFSIDGPVDNEQLNRGIDTFWNAYEEKKFQDEADKLITHFQKISEAPEELNTGLENDKFLEEVQPWLEKTGLYGSAGLAAVNMLLAEEEGDYTEAWNNRVKLNHAMAKAEDISKSISLDKVKEFVTQAKHKSSLVTITTPSDGGSVQEGEDVKIRAEVNSGDREIDKVEFYAGLEKIGKSQEQPYEVIWESAPEGKHLLKAVATDQAGNVVSSEEITLTVGNPKSLLLVVGSDADGTVENLSSGDQSVKDRLELLGYPVEVQLASETGATAAEGKGGVVISSTVSSGDVNTKFTNVDIPVITWEAYILDDLGMADNVGETWDQTEITITEEDSNLSSGFSGDITVYNGPNRLRWGTVSEDAEVAAVVPGQTDQATLFGYHAGADMVGRTAPSSRVGLFLGDDGIAVTTEAGTQLFDNAIRWAMENQ